MRPRGLGHLYLPTFRDRHGVQKRSPVWHIQYFHRGVRHRESSQSTNKADAVRLLRRRLKEIEEGTLIAPNAAKVTVADLLQLVTDDYQANSRKSLARTKSAIRHLSIFFANALAIEVTGARANKYIHSRQADGAKPASIKYELAMLKRGFMLGIRAGLIASRPYLPSLEVRNVRTGFFESEDFQAVLGYLPADIKPVAFFSYCTGWRIRSEVLPLQWSQVDFKAGIVRLDVGSTKNDEGRTLPFAVLPHLATVLHRQRKLTSDLERETGEKIPWVFHRRGKRILDFRGAWKKACRLAKVPGRIPHDFRRTAVRNLERAGVSRSVAMKITGHKTESVYKRYAIVSEADLSEGLTKLARLHAQEVQDLPDLCLTWDPGTFSQSLAKDKGDMVESVSESLALTR